MAADDQFVQSVKIEGIFELIAAFNRLGDVGERAFDKIGDGAAGAAKPLSDAEKAAAAAAKRIEDVEKSAFKFGQSLGGVGSALSDIVDAVENSVKKIGILTAAVTGAATAAGIFIARTLDTIDRIEEQASALGLGTRAFQEYQAAAVAGGATAKQFATGVQNVNRLIASGIKEQDQALLNLNDRIEKSQKKFRGVIQISPTLSRDIAKENDLIEQKVAEIADKIQKPAFEVRNALRAMAAGSAESRKQLEQFGIFLPSLSGNLDALRQSAEKGGNVLNRLGIPLRDNTGKARTFESIIGDIAEKLGAIDDPALRAATAAEVFGRQAGALANTFGNGREEAQKFINEARRMGLILDESVIKKAAAAQAKVDLLGLAVTSLRSRFVASFSGPVTEGVTALTNLISENQDAFEALGTRISDFVTPALRDFIQILAGNRDKVKDTSWVKQLTIGLENVYKVVKDKVVFAFNLLLEVGNKLSQLFKFFGKDVEPGLIVAFIAVTALTGGFTTMFKVIAGGIALVTALGRGVGLLRTLLGAGGGAAGAATALGTALRSLTVPGAIATALVLILTNIDKIKAAVDLVAKALDDAFGTTIFTSLGSFVKLLLDIVDTLKVLLTTSAEVRQFFVNLIPAPVMFVLNEVAKLINGIATSLKAAATEAAAWSEALRRLKAGEIGFKDLLSTVSKIREEMKAAGTATAKSADEISSANKKIGTSAQEAANKARPLTKTGEGTYQLLEKQAKKAADNIEKDSARIPATQRELVEADKRAAELAAQNTEASTEKQKTSLVDLQKTFEKGSEPVYAFGRAIKEGLGAAITHEIGNVQSLIKHLQELGAFLTKPLLGGDQQQPTAAPIGGGTEFGSRNRGAAGASAQTLDPALEASENLGNLTSAAGLAQQAVEALRQVIVKSNDCLKLFNDNIITTDSNLRVFQEETAKSGVVLDETKGKVTEFGDSLSSLDLSGKFNEMASAIGQVVDGITSRFQELVSGIGEAANAMAASVSSALDQVISKIDAAIQKARELASSVSSAGSGGGGGGGSGVVEAASGGLIRGPGGIDNVPAWLTNREFVVNADATARHLPLLHAINRGLRLPEFNMGGLVSSALSSLAPPSPRLAMATGGLVMGNGGASHRISLDFGGGTVVQVMGSPNAVNQISAEALRRKAASAGRPPRR